MVPATDRADVEAWIAELAAVRDDEPEPAIDTAAEIPTTTQQSRLATEHEWKAAVATAAPTRSGGTVVLSSGRRPSFAEFKDYVAEDLARRAAANYG